jgi:hypothetical protein
MFEMQDTHPIDRMASIVQFVLVITAVTTFLIIATG